MVEEALMEMFPLNGDNNSGVLVIASMFLYEAVDGSSQQASR